MQRGFNVIAKSIDSYQPAQSAQADTSQYFLKFCKLSHIKRIILPQDLVNYLTKWILFMPIIFVQCTAW